MWELLPEDEKELYKKSIQAYASLTEAFSQKNEDLDKLVPIITSKNQEKLFCSCFHGTVEDIGNTAFDASVKKVINDKVYKFLVGIKTFRFASSDQKIAQFKKSSRDWEDIKHEIKVLADTTSDIDEFNEKSYGLYYRLAVNIATIRNQRIDSAISNLKGFDVLKNDSTFVEAVYHVLMPENDGTPIINVGETSYDKIDINNIKIISKKSLKLLFNFDFDDGKHVYKYTDSDSQLLMNFRNEEIVVEQWPVKFRKDPTADLIKLYDSEENNINIQTITESYDWKINVERYSGFNSFYGLSSKMGGEKREKRARQFIERIGNQYDATFVANLSELLLDFCNQKNNSKERLTQREKLRDLVRLSSVGVLDEKDYKELISLLYRPTNEFYIPIPNAKQFHLEHPDFFGNGIIQFKEDGKTLKFTPAERSFNLIFEPSGNAIKSYIGQDSGKGIESTGMQTILGKWILRDIFQVDEYQPVTQEMLDNLNINTIRVYKVKEEPVNNVHLEFVNVDE